MSENEQEKKKTATSNLDIKLWAVGSFLFILMSVFGYLAYLNLHFPPTERENYATLGDSFGILSSLFSGLAFAGLIVTIVMQNKTLKAQMEELELARKEYKRQGDELAGQKEVMNMQLTSIHQQQFETTFFKLLDIYEKSTDEISGGAPGFRLKELADSDVENLEGRSYLVNVGGFFTKVINEPYEMVYKKYESKVWTTKIHNYVNLILYILKYVDGKDDYMQLFLSQVPIECYLLIAFELHIREDYTLIDIVIRNRMFRSLEMDFNDESISKSSYLRTIFEKYPKSVFSPSFMGEIKN